jgi:cytoskeletal protein RodZ
MPPAPRTVGDRLRAAPEARGLSLDEMAEATKVRRVYLADIEAMRIEALPSRPYAIGYVRAYAEALGLDPDALVSRFRAEMPEPDQTFRAPVGVAFEERNRWSLMAGAGGMVVVAILLWNVAQRAMTLEHAPEAAVAEAPESWTLASAPSAPLAIGPAIPPPAEQTVPAPYETPGMAEYFAAQQGQVLAVANTGAAAAAPPTTGSAPARPVQAAFNPRGAVYGATPQRSTVILQARKPAFIIVRGRDDVVHFARQLAAGEAYRAPTVEGLTVEVSNPADFDLYRDGELQGPLAAPQTSLDKLAMSAATTPAG